MPYNLIHILGVAFGLGVATGMDFLLMRNILKRSLLSSTHVDSIVLLSMFVSAALIMLWLSGIGFLYCYYTLAPEKLQNPKIWSKLSIVLILTINGFVIHHLILPKLRQCIGNTVLEALPYRTLSLFFAAGALSFISWYFPFLYGTLPGLNFTFSFVEFSMAYTVSTVVTVSIALSVLGALYANMVSEKLDHAALMLKKRGSRRKFVSLPLRKRSHLIKRCRIKSAA